MRSYPVFSKRLPYSADIKKDTRYSEAKTMNTNSAALFNMETIDEYICSNAEHALEQDEFVVMYQPKFDIKTLQTVGAEALVRWQLPNGQTVPPDRFIPYFEEQGYIRQLDFLVLEKVCKMLARTIRNGFVPVPVSVNFSRLHIHTPGFAERLHKTVSSYNIPAGLIEVEITESAFVGDVTSDYVLELIEQLRALGYTVAMDDFGAGFSSLNDLMNLKVDVLKLDRAFLQLTGRNEARARCIIHAVIQMAKALGITVVAEGIEDAHALSILRQCGCDVGQGYYYSRPVEESRCRGFLKRCSVAN